MPGPLRATAINGGDATSKLWWAVPAAAFLLLISLALVLGKQQEPRGAGTSYDASSRGFRAAYLLLEELDYPVARSRRAGGRGPRLVLFPTPKKDEAAVLDAWVRGGGTVVLADDSGDFAGQMGIRLEIDKAGHEGMETATLEGKSARLELGPTVLKWPGKAGDVWLRTENGPLVTVHRHGRGEVWLLNRPEFVKNGVLKEADNAVLLCRLVEAVLDETPGPLAFDEYCHGMRDRPDVVELLLRPPALWVTLQGLLLLALLLWHFAPRFGNPQAPPAGRRRSKEEFLDALAALLERKKDYADAWRTAREELVHDIEWELGLPAGAEIEDVAREAGQRWRIPPERLLGALEASPASRQSGPQALLRALNELETMRGELFDGRNDR